MNVMENHAQYTNQFLELIKQNPELRVFPLVENEVCAGDEHTYWCGMFGESKVDEIYMDEELVWIRSQDEELLIDRVLDETIISFAPTTPEEYAKKIVDSYKWEKVIVVYIVV